FESRKPIAEAREEAIDSRARLLDDLAAQPVMLRVRARLELGDLLIRDRDADRLRDERADDAVDPELEKRERAERLDLNADEDRVEDDLRYDELELVLAGELGRRVPAFLRRPRAKALVAFAVAEEELVVVEARLLAIGSLDDRRELRLVEDGLPGILLEADHRRFEAAEALGCEEHRLGR